MPELEADQAPRLATNEKNTACASLLWGRLAEQLVPLATRLREAAPDPVGPRSGPGPDARARMEHTVRQIEWLIGTWSLAVQLAQGELVLHPESVELGKLVKRAVEAYHPVLCEQQHVIAGVGQATGRHRSRRTSADNDDVS